MFKLCPNCGAHNAPTANFCTKCGANLAGVAARQPQAPATPDTTDRKTDTVSATSQSAVATAPTAD
ncbi:zinc-ribbon domain-containing protein, partial [Lacticaseibacillus rhamnosus]|uniref:zinc-ribbon domain-containing protein n=1 Tax=Lacticaseibacillus rhamnosus TaxID=47715 RepID=UPI00232F1495